MKAAGDLGNLPDVPPIDSAYPPVIESIARRISAAEDALDEVRCNPDHPQNWISCELATLQIRMICELLLLGSTLAHLKEGGKELDDRKWRPKEAFGQLDRINAHPLQVPVEVLRTDQGGPQISPISKPLPFEAISKVYGICGDLLHVPTARQVLKASLPVYDVEQLQKWLAGLKRVIVSHALMLPERKKVLLSIWSGLPDETPKCFLLNAMGESTLDLNQYPDFDLLP